MYDNLREDTRRLREIKTKSAPWYVIESLLFENGYQAVVLHRIAHWFKSHRIPFCGPLAHRISLFLTGVDIAPAAKIGPGFRISHGVGLVIGNGARLGANVLLMQQVTIGAPSQARIEAMPMVGDNVTIGAGARLIGKISIGENTFIGTNAVVTQDIPANSKVVVRVPLDITTRTDRSA